MRIRLLRGAIVCFLIAVVVIGIIALNFYIFSKTPGVDAERLVMIDKGESLDAIAAKLESEGVVSNAVLFKIYVRVWDSAEKIHAGEYRFPPKVISRDVLSMLLKGDFATQRITIPEGWTMKEIANYLGTQKLVDPKKFLVRCVDPNFIRSMGVPSTTLEGYLFPDTYEIYRPKDEEEVLEKLVGHFKRIYTPEFELRAQELGMTQQQVVTLASIIEKETGQVSERPIISSVFWNRLKKGIPLATDPTIIYGIKDYDGNIRKEDLQRPGPYNTYLNVGLPPTPIANPGLEAIKAALYPAQTDYLFFVSKNDGTHYFSRTMAEHGDAVRFYQINRQQH